MHSSKSQPNLHDVKISFQQTGLIDWHLSPRMAENPIEHEGDGDLAVQTAPP